ncbi:hypothetical protein EYS14_17985 [Alteromonadaceae bacterium M269]|nr:hypothetical protein EYS14_17985 [Alteromonadaceae bacterium M269]
MGSHGKNQYIDYRCTCSVNHNATIYQETASGRVCTVENITTHGTGKAVKAKDVQSDKNSIEATAYNSVVRQLDKAKVKLNEKNPIRCACTSGDPYTKKS